MNQPSFLLMAHSFTSRPRSNRLGIFFHFFPQASQFKFKLHLGSLGKQHAKWILVFAVDAEGACHGNPTTFRKETTFSTGYSEGATLKKPFLLSGVGVFFCTKQLVTCARAHTHTRRSFDNISIVNGVRKFSLNLTISEVLAAMEDMEDMEDFKLNLKTLEGGVITVQVTPRNTIEDLKTMLCEKKAEHPNELKILTAEVLVGGALVHSDSQTLEAAGLLDAESEVTVVYSRKEVEAATKKAIYAQRASSKWTSLPLWWKYALQSFPWIALKLSGWQSLSLLRPLGGGAFAGCSILGKHHYPRVCYGHWRQLPLKVAVLWSEHHSP